MKGRITYIGLVMPKQQRRVLDERIAALARNRSHFVRTAIRRLLLNSDEVIAGYLRANKKVYPGREQ